MNDLIPFGSKAYFVFLLVLLFSRGMDFFSTWMATPNLVLEGNPIAKKMGWRWGVALNVVISVGLAFSALSAIVLSTTSVLVAARNFQSAWLMRSLGEEAYRDWYVSRIQETRVTTYLICLAGNTLLTAAVGAAVIYFSRRWLIPFSIGMGIIGYAGAVAFYTLLAFWRIRRATVRELAAAKNRAFVSDAPIQVIPLNGACACEPSQSSDK
ncbi:MAG TPA: hypothetical protein VFM25_13640 [Verrucomicrobiae bacterium]|nr:hypothetical protein [Verrucomicrobiae bacterium]